MNRHVIVPAKKRVNPWTVARVYWWAPLVAVCVASWPVSILTGAWARDDAAWYGMAAAWIALVSAALGVLVVAFSSPWWAPKFAHWWRDRESKYGQVDDR